MVFVDMFWVQGVSLQKCVNYISTPENANNEIFEGKNIKASHLSVDVAQNCIAISLLSKVLPSIERNRKLIRICGTLNRLVQITLNLV